MGDQLDRMWRDMHRRSIDPDYFVNHAFGRALAILGKSNRGEMTSEEAAEQMLAVHSEALLHRCFFQESTFARYQCGLDENGPKPEPDADPAFSISLRVDKSLEPKWFAVKGRDEGHEVERKPIYAANRAFIGLSRRCGVLACGTSPGLDIVEGLLNYGVM